ncbi:MAG: F0F1 ATP synthase subunit gamma [Candidatus Omnitrophica bacterium]|nr:F0F1 ATP synthase subunit gamma [Candidatus Omnitrophota bacterium]
MLELTKVKKNIEFNDRFKSILEVLKSIAVSQFHMLERKLNIFEPFDHLLQDFFDSIDTNQINHPLLQGGNYAKAVIAVTSDQGLLGGLNMRVVSAALSLLRPSRDYLVIIGEQGKVYARQGKTPFTTFPGVHDYERHKQALSLRNYLFEKINQKKFMSVQVVYPHAISLVNQKIEQATLLPLPRDSAASASDIDLSQAILESSLVHMLEFLAYLRVGSRLEDIFGISRVAEMAARYMRLEESTQKIQEMNRKLKLQYFRLRHAVIDQSMRELFSARMLYAEDAF